MKKIAKQEIMFKLVNHPIYQHVMSAVSGSQKQNIEKQVERFVEQFSMVTIDKLHDLKEQDPVKVREALKKFQDESKAKLLSTVKLKKS